MRGKNYLSSSQAGGSGSLWYKLSSLLLADKRICFAVNIMREQFISLTLDKLKYNGVCQHANDSFLVGNVCKSFTATFCDQCNEIYFL